jgi:branched-chain amino acid transport system substrate-binding protein
MINKKIFLILGIIIIIIALVLVFTINKAEKKEVIKIGILTDLSADNSSWGLAVKDGVLLADKESNKNIKIFFEDSKCDLKEGVNAVNKLVNINKVDVVYGTVCSHVTMGSSNITNPNKVILLSVGASSPEITNAGEYVYRLWPSDLIETKSIVEYMSKIENISIGIIYMNNDYGVGVKDALVTFSKENNIDIVASESFLQTDVDFKTQLIKIKEKSPQAIYIVANPPQAKIIFDQIEELDLNQKLFAPGWLMEDGLIIDSVNQSMLERVKFASLEFDVPEEFISKTNQPNFVISALAYDGYKLLLEVIDKCSNDRECIKQELDVINYSGITGNISFDENGDVLKDFTIKTFVDGEIVKVENIE